MPPWIERVVQKVAPLARWEDLELSQESVDTLRRIVVDARAATADRRSKNGARSKGKPSTGVVALFNGPQGPHKVAAAQVLARELKMNLFRVDTKLVVSDSLEETECTMKRIIDGAEEAGGALFFDQADVLFGRDESGGEVDLGIRYLLKRAGRYEDLTLIAVADKDQMDLVHLRKLRSVVEFGS